MTIRAPAARQPRATPAPRWALSAGLTAVAVLCVAVGNARADDGPAHLAAEEAQALIRDLDLDRARAVLDVARQVAPGDVELLDAAALLALYEGDYAKAAEFSRSASAGRPGSTGEAGPHKDLRALAESTFEATRGMARFTADDGRYVVLAAPGVDEVLVPYAFAALRSADAAYSQLFGYRHPGPVRLEIYGSPAALAQVSNLSVADIERTGTIALSKWDRLMITSPRALLRGYPWLDTIAHEYVHLTLSRATRDRAPVWLQEGVARFLERRWRGETTFTLDPSSARLLWNATKSGKLIAFDRMHPSIARLPSQEDAALAFAQVSTLISRAVRTAGESVLAATLERVRGGSDARAALAEAAGTSWSELEAGWRKDLAGAPAPPPAREPFRMRRFRHGASGDESLDVREKNARVHVRLGDMLYARGRKGGAAAEYARAQRYAKDDPIIATRLGRAAVEAGDGAAALAGVGPLAAAHADYAPIHVILGHASALLGRDGDASREYYEAIWLSPFDPEPHCGLAQVAPDQATRTREQRFCSTLRGSNLGTP